jgi:hypothetical protein
VIGPRSVLIRRVHVAMLQWASSCSQPHDVEERRGKGREEGATGRKGRQGARESGEAVQHTKERRQPKGKTRNPANRPRHRRITVPPLPAPGTVTEAHPASVNSVAHRMSWDRVQQPSKVERVASSADGMRHDDHM